jgi:hypothetical protein
MCCQLVVKNRFNAIYIDGAVSNDVWFAANGTNGGQSGVSVFY